MSQPALTKSVHQLEEEVGVLLLERSTRGVTLTSAGKAFVVRARAIQAELARAQEELASHATDNKGAVAIGMAPLAALLLFPLALRRFRISHPTTMVRVIEASPGVLLPMLRAQSLDLVVTKRSLGTQNSSIQVRPLLRTPLVVAGRRGHPRASAQSLADLVDADWLIFSPLGEPGTVLHELFDRAGLRTPHAAIQTESYATAIEVLAHTDAVGVVSPSLLARRWAEQIQQINIAQAVPSITLSLYVRKGSPPSKAGAAMGKALSAVAKEVALMDRKRTLEAEQRASRQR